MFQTVVYMILDSEPGVMRVYDPDPTGASVRLYNECLLHALFIRCSTGALVDLCRCLIARAFPGRSGLRPLPVCWHSLMQ
jgi:hypothetical protein